MMFLTVAVLILRHGGPNEDPAIAFSVSEPDKDEIWARLKVRDTKPSVQTSKLRALQRRI